MLHYDVVSTHFLTREKAPRTGCLWAFRAGVCRYLLDGDDGAAVLVAVFRSVVTLLSLRVGKDLGCGITALHDEGLEGLGALLTVADVDLFGTDVVGVADDEYLQLLVGLQVLDDGVEGIVGLLVELGIIIAASNIFGNDALTTV